MYNLFRHIEFLILRHDCVIIPGFGAFIVTTSPARIDRENCRIYPPCRSVMFNQAVNLDDGLLANSYARSMSLTFEEARQVILKDVGKLMAYLKNNGRVQIGRLGCIELGTEEKLIFIPSSTPEKDARTLGFSSISLLSLSDSYSNSHNSLSIPSLVEKDHTHYHFRINRTLSKFAAVFTLLFLILVAVILYPVPTDSREQRASVVPVDALIQSKKTIVVDKDTDPSVVNIKDETIAEPSSAVMPKYYLIVGTFTTPNEAERFAEKNSTSEYPLEAISSRKLTRVSIAMSNDKEELIKKLNSQQIINRFPQAWIWSASD